ncbi:MAG: sialate O-acetylesterase [Pirellulaceae bacterium]
MVRKGRIIFLGWLALGTIIIAVNRVHADTETVKVFILAGQSNMEGKAKNSLLDHQATDPETAELFTHLRDGDDWVVRDDVFIKFLNRKGPLTIGYGSPNRTGVELEFGWKMGDHFDEPVILIKAAWGGHSLWKLFRPPSSGMPDDEFLEQELKQARERVKKNNEKNNRNEPMPTMEDIKEPYGKSYRNMLAEVDDVFNNHETLFPSLEGKQLDVAGFVWFQGWNDMFGELGPPEYEQNMKNLVQDLREDLDAPEMPVVIAAMGQNGSKPAEGNMAAIQNAQFAMNDVPEFKGNVKTIATDLLVDKAAEELYPNWRDHVEKWEKTGSDFGYHYMGSAIWFNRIGRAMGDAMLELMGEEK